ncbi:MAG: SDR family NAD(P)-dependent oxidoreductase [Planctomycetaceae bacterium]|nr:SDR family NAD(P)-dependent oxidoreductase [Planctomycetaceae bacterium]
MTSVDTPQVGSQLKSYSREPLAVIGIGCRLPGGITCPVEFWDALLKGIDAICDVPEDRWKHSRFHDTNPEKSGCIRNAKGGFIKGVDQFDGEFFGYFPAEAQRIDPQQRLLLEVTHEAMEDAGLRRDQLDGSRTAVFVGSFMYDYLCMQAASEQRDEINPYAAMGTSVSALANRISYDFNLQGPSVSLDTACSSSLVALHLACRSVWGGEADMAIAGGVNVMLRPESSIMLSKAGFLNPDQYCKAFAATANGYVRAEGVGVVILKPLKKAIAEGDSIYACVCATGVNQDGRSPEGFTVPNFSSQSELLKVVYAEAGIDPSSVDFVETHGTGTRVGDPIESLALGVVLGSGRTKEQPNLLIGSVKTNLGHLEGAAGIAGFIKGVLTAYHGVAPPNLHFSEPNPGILFEERRLEVPTRSIPLRRTDHPLTVGVNSFGAGGTNAHVVLQEVGQSTLTRDRPGSTTDGAPNATLYALNSAHRDSLRTLALRHADYLSSTQHPLDDIAYSAFTRRSHYQHLMAVVGESAEDVEGKLRKFANGEADSEILTATIAHRKNPKLAFVFSGQGGQWARMGLQLMRRESVFRECMEEVEGLFRQLAGWSLLAELQKGEDHSRVNDTVVVQPAVMAVQVALVKLYEHYGIRPSGVVGHSIGEVAAAFAAGALTLERAVEVIYHRSQAQDLVSGKGGMLAVGLAQEEAEKLIEGFADSVSIGAVNGPEMLTLSGDSTQLQRIGSMLEVRGVFNRPVRVQVPYHSHYIDAIKDLMLDALADVQGFEATTPLFSTVTGRRESGMHLNAEYWFHNARQPVLFTKALTTMLQARFDTFVEIGPHPVLIRGGEALAQELNTDAFLAPSMTRQDPEITVFLQSLAQLATRGFHPDTDVLFGAKRRYVRIPNSPWQHSRYWFESPAVAELRRGAFEHPFLKRRIEMATEEGIAVWEATVNVQKFPYLNDHQVDGEIVFPATGHVELAWAAAGEQFRHENLFLENLHFESPLILPDKNRHPLEVRMEVVSGEGDYRICSRPVGEEGRDSTWSKHSTGRINRAHDRFEKSTVSLVEVRGQFHEDDELSVETFYETVSAAGLEYGPGFRCIQQLWQHGREILARLELPTELEYESKRNAIHPALLDACLHAVFADIHRTSDPQRVFLPYSIERVRIYRQPRRTVWSHVRVTRSDEQYICLDTTIFDEGGELVAEVLGVTCKRLGGSGLNLSERLYEGCYEYNWTASPRDADVHGRNFDYTTAALIVPDGQDPGDAELVDTLAMRLDKEGVRPVVIRSRSDVSYNELLTGIPLDRRTLIVFAAGLSRSRSGWQGLADCPYVPSLLNLAQALHKSEGVPRLCVVTHGAAGVAGDQQLDLGHAILHGMSRVINNECPNIPLSVIDLSQSATRDEVESLVTELLHNRRDRDESEICLRGEQRYVRQLMPVGLDTAEQLASTEEDGFGGDYRAEVSAPGALDQIVFRRLPPSEFGDNDVEIAVRAAALNFKDVMNAMGLLPANAVAGGLTADRLGLEVAGRVLRTGSLVTHVQADDEVIARVPEGFCGRVITRGEYVVRRPKRLTPQQAAAVPLVYITAWHSLCYLARMASNDTVLIHSAAGGVGGAAIRLAQRVGANVIATAGTETKRESLRQMGIEHVFDSRSLDFYNQVMEATNGRGVDIVLNSLTGRFIAQGIKCLAPFGRFVEIGKADIYRNSKLNLERLGENISYFVVDVDRLAVQQPALHRQALTEVAELFDRGELEPHEITEFPISKLPEAIRFMTRAAHQGKIVMNMEGDRVHTLPPREAAFRSDRTYLISGGASGFGLHVARWMADRGARHLVLLSRSGCKTAEDERCVLAMREFGVEITLAKANISDAAAVRQLVQQIENESPPLAGVIHGAAVLDDASIPNMDIARFERVFSPKAQGAWNLHEATLASQSNLDFFVLLSSISSVLGLFGQLNYAAANFFQDALANYRRQSGLPATSVNLGVLGQYAGMSKPENDEQDIIGLLETQGMYVMPLEDVLAKLEAALIQQPTQRMTARLDWPWFRLAYPHLVRDARFVDLMSDAALTESVRSKGGSLRAELADLEPAERLKRLEQELTGKLARILDAAPEKLDVSKSIDSFGLDSLMLTDFQISIVRSLDVNIPLIKLLKGPSIATLATETLEQLDVDGSAESGTTQDTKEAAADFTLADLEGIEVLNPWLIRGSSNPEAPVRLICFHSMGVGASLFTRFLLNPPEDYDILAVQTPGRENRIAEPLAESVDELVDQIVPQLLPHFDRPVVIWGHSFGGIVAWETMRRLRELHHREAAHFVVTGTAAPNLMPQWQQREVLLKAMVADNSPEYLASLSRYVEDLEFFKALVPGMRRDFPLLQSYRFEPMSCLKCPITAFAAGKDDFAYIDQIQEWERYTEGDFALIEVDGDHWFIDRNRELITATLQGIAVNCLKPTAEHAVRSTAM